MKQKSKLEKLHNIFQFNVKTTNQKNNRKAEKAQQNVKPRKDFLKNKTVKRLNFVTDSQYS